MNVDLTNTERVLLIQTVETSTYAGKLAYIVAEILTKLRDASEEKKEQ